MAQAELFNIDSPCVQVCEMDDKGYCKGCLRNRTERQLWHAMNNEQKRQVLRLLFGRRQKRKRQHGTVIANNSGFEQGIEADFQLSLLESETKLEAKLEATLETKIEVATTLPQAKMLKTVSINPMPILPKPVKAPEALTQNSPYSPLPTKINVVSKPAMMEENLDFFEVLAQSLQG